jgi:hypothetical protein
LGSSMAMGLCLDLNLNDAWIWFECGIGHVLDLT